VELELSSCEFKPAEKRRSYAGGEACKACIIDNFTKKSILTRNDVDHERIKHAVLSRWNPDAEVPASNL